MTPYVLLLVLVVLTSYAGRRTGRPLGRALGTAVACILLILFAGMRDYRVGTDTPNYRAELAQITSFESAMSDSMEVGYNLLSWLAKAISDSFSSLLLLIAAVVVPLYVTTIVKLVKRYETGVYLFIVLGTYTFAFNGARQALAAAICFWAIRFILDRRFLPYAAAVGFAMLFHKTALVALPLYIVAAPRLRLARLAGLFAAAAVISVFLRVFVGFAADLLDDRFASYAEEGEGGGMVMGAFLMTQGALLFWLRKFIKTDREVYIRLLNVYLVGLIPVIVSILSSINPSGLLRLHIYFTPAAILLWPMVFRHVHGTQQRALIGFAFLVFTMVFFVMTTSAFSGLVPYRVNAEFL